MHISGKEISMYGHDGDDVGIADGESVGGFVGDIVGGSEQSKHVNRHPWRSSSNKGDSQYP